MDTNSAHLEHRLRSATSPGTSQPRRRGAPWLGLVFLVVPYLWMLWAEPYPIMQDLSGHIETAFLHARLRAQDPAYEPYYQVAPQPWPNSLGVHMTSLLGPGIGFLTAAKVCLSVYLLSWPLSIALLAQRLGRSPWLAGLCLPAALDFNWAMGFFHFLLAKPLAILAIACAIPYGRQHRDGAHRLGWLRGMGLFALLAATFLAHAMVWVFATAAAAAAVAWFARGRWRVLGQWPLLLAGLVALPYGLAQTGAQVPGRLVFWEPWKNFTLAWIFSGHLHENWGDQAAWIAAAAAWLLLLVVGTIKHRRGTLVPDKERATGFLVLGLISVLAAFFLGPANIPNVDLVAVRFLVFAWVALMLLPRVTARGAQGVAFFALLFAASTTHAATTKDQYRKFGAEMKGFRELVERLPVGAGVATWYPERHSRHGAHNAFWHWPKLITVWRGGYTDDTFSWRTTHFVRLTERGYKDRWAPWFQLQPAKLRRWSFLLVHGPESSYAGLARHVEAVGHAAGWHLLRVKK